MKFETNAKTTLLVFVCCCLVAMSVCATIGGSTRQAREVSHQKQQAQSVKATCQGLTPCGWAVYKQFTRNIDYFMKNTCVCPMNKLCVRTEDDISVLAYVYRCKEKEKD